MQPPTVVQAPAPTKRIYYLDWLRVLAILMVFLFHAMHPFDFSAWHVKNAEQSELLSIILILLALWGMPFFFMVAGSASWFALLRRTPNQYVNERVKRLVIPYMIGVLLFWLLMTYLEWGNGVYLGTVKISFAEYLANIGTALANLGFTPRWLAFGMHLWFVGFLFAFAVITLPLFLWFKRDPGTRVIDWMARACDHRGGLLLFIIPLSLVKFAFEPFFSQQHDWQDFTYRMSFFVLGFILYADARFTRAIRRDWWILFGLGLSTVVVLLGLNAMGFPVQTWADTQSESMYFPLKVIGATIALCFSLTFVYVGMRWLDSTSNALVYLQEAVLPFFILHQPVILLIAFFVVQWQVGLELKLATVVVGSFAVVVALYELLIRRIKPLRVLFGMTK